MIAALANRLWETPAFREEYDTLLRVGMARSVGLEAVVSDTMLNDVLPRLLNCATYLTGGNQVEHREAAYRIAVTALGLSGSQFDNLPEVAHVILGRLGNFPAVGHLFRNGGHGNLPLPLQWELDAREQGNRVQVAGVNVTLTDFQRRLWAALEQGKPTVVTAPTSAGKSFALKRFLADRLLAPHDGPGPWGVYVVPTRALITQVSVELIALLRELRSADHEPDPSTDPQVITIPVPPTELGAARGIYVVTQERLQTLIERGEPIDFSLVVIDEAHAVSDSGRGIILQTVVETVRRSSTHPLLFFGCPFVRNPEVFQAIFGLNELEPVEERESPVAQNLVMLDTSQVDRSTLHVRAILERNVAEPVFLGNLDIGIELAPGQPQSLAAVSWALGRQQKNLVYASSPANCEVVADILAQFAADEVSGSTSLKTTHPKLVELAGFLRDHIHPDYLLANTVLYGIGFHYGRMPNMVRKLLEEYFIEGLLSHLVCTSTLLAGVNLPAKNLFLLNPTRGDDEEKTVPITSVDFWNLAGRAGRLGKDFEGNVFLLDQHLWSGDPLIGPREQEVTSALTTTTVTEGEKFLEFLEDNGHPSGQWSARENAFVKLFNEARRGTLATTLDRLYGETSLPVREAIQARVERAAYESSVPTAVTEKNINVSVYRQDELLSYLIKRIREKGPDYVIPLHPLSSGEVYQSLLKVFYRIAKYVEHTKNKSPKYFAAMALKWMRGEPLRRLIEDAYERARKERKKAGNPRLSTVIRKVMATVEDDLRFRYVKYTRCYNDLLLYALKEAGHSGLESRIPTLPLYLELGACSGTMVSMIGLGLTRTTAAAAAAFAPRVDYDRIQAERWLRRQTWEGRNISPICVREIEQVLL